MSWEGWTKTIKKDVKKIVDKGVEIDNIKIL